MCGVFGWFDIFPDAVQVKGALHAARHRGPDAEDVFQIGPLTLGHSRLAIIDLDERSNQPFRYGDTLISFNGEIWNYKEVRQKLAGEGLHFYTQGDVEVLAALLHHRGLDGLNDLQGMFAVAWTSDGGQTVTVARDRFGEVPMHIAPSFGMFASEVKILHAMGAPPSACVWLQPGTAVTFSRDQSDLLNRPVATTHRWYRLPTEPLNVDRTEAASGIRKFLEEGSLERTIADAPVAVLLSGGVDSAAVLALARAALEDKGRVTAFTAVMDRKSRDLYAARQLAEYFDVNLIEVVVPEPTGERVRDVVHAIEQPHKAQVEIGIACLYLSERISRLGFKVVLSGEGSDELWASYGLSYHGIQRDGWHGYRRKLYVGQHRKNFARCNKIFMAHGVECRLPFLNTNLAEYALNLSQEAVQDGKRRPKAVLQEAVSDLLPAEIVNRPKLAFQDAMGLKKRMAEFYHDPKAIYKAEFQRRFEGMKP